MFRPTLVRARNMANIRFINPGKNARSLPSDPSARSDVEQVMEHGYIVMKDVFTRGEAESVKTEIKRLTGSAPLTGRNNFEGVDTTRIYSLLNKSRKFDDFCIIPRVLALNDYFLDPGYMISVLQTIQINPGEKAQPLHHDDAYTGLPRPRDPLSTGIVFAFDEFTETNGATRIIPGSHKWDSNRIPQEHETIPMACPAGSVLYFVGTVWHGGGENKTDKPRVSGTCQYCQPWIRPIENQLLAVDPRRLPEIPEEIVSMMGYRTHDPFIGYADGLNPLRATRRLVNWLQSPLDRNPPTFASRLNSKL